MQQPDFMGYVLADGDGTGFRVVNGTACFCLQNDPSKSPVELLQSAYENLDKVCASGLDGNLVQYKRTFMHKGNHITHVEKRDAVYFFYDSTGNLTHVVDPLCF